MGEIYYVGQVLLAVMLGGILGWQREHWGKHAGPRTYALVTAGSALFTILSIHAFSGDTSRVASQIVIGIGFLGAGTILHKHDDQVEGLTTAAGLWFAAAIGMAVGLGFYVLSLASTILALIILAVHSHQVRMENKLVDKKKK